MGITALPYKECVGYTTPMSLKSSDSSIDSVTKLVKKYNKGVVIAEESKT